MQSDLAMVTLVPDIEELPRTTVPAVFRTDATPGPRTLNDILAQTARRHPHAPALDDGEHLLSYRALIGEVEQLHATLAAAGIGRGDRVGVRVPSGTIDLYVAILAVLAAGAAYVPVDAEDPDERAELVFGAAGVCAVIGAERSVTHLGTPLGVPGPA